MAKLSNDELIESFKEMSLIELSEFVKQFEEVFDVTAAAPVAVAQGAAAGGGEAPAEEEQKTEFDGSLEAAGSAKIAVIKEVRRVPSRGVQEAKALVDEAPKPALEGVRQEDADAAKPKLEDAGATVTVKGSGALALRAPHITADSARRAVPHRGAALPLSGPGRASGPVREEAQVATGPGRERDRTAGFGRRAATSPDRAAPVGCRCDPFVTERCLRIP